MAHRLVQPRAQENLLRRLGRERLQFAFHPFVPRSEHDQLHILLEEKILVREQKIDAFLLRQPAHHAKDSAFEFGIEARTFQQLHPARRLALQIRRRVARRQQNIRRRIPHRLVHAVEQTGKVLNPRLDHTVHPAAKLGRLYLLCIARTHRGDPVGKKNAAFQQADLRIILDPVDLVEFVRQIRPRKSTRREEALIGDVVNRKHRLQRQGRPVPPFRLTDQQWNQPRLPVVRMHDVGLQIRQPHGLDHRFREKDEPLRVVLVIAFAVSIRGPAVEKLLPANQIDREVFSR